MAPLASRKQSALRSVPRCTNVPRCLHERGGCDASEPYVRHQARATLSCPDHRHDRALNWA
jgi:hypothetical protein